MGYKLGMAAVPDDRTSPVLANIVVVAGFVAIFTTFATGSPWSWIVGGLMVVAGALWAGAPGGPTTTAPADAVDAGGQHHGHTR